MFRLEVVNQLTCMATCEDGEGALFTKAGAMIAYQGKCKFKKVLLGPEGNALKAITNQIGRRMTGENMPLMEVKSKGKTVSYYANLGQNIAVVDLNPGEELKVESENLLAFTDGCGYSFKFLAQGVISQKGLFTSVLKGEKPGAQAAVICDGNPVILPTPCYADPDALVAWIGSDPEIHLDVGWKNFIGQSSGESYSFKFNQPGGQVLLQPFERQSGIHIGIDDKRYTPSNPNTAYSGRPQGTGNNIYNNQYGPNNGYGNNGYNNQYGPNNGYGNNGYSNQYAPNNGYGNNGYGNNPYSGQYNAHYGNDNYYNQYNPNNGYGNNQGW